MTTYCLALDLKDAPTLIAEYKRYHEPGVIWPEVVDRIKSDDVISEEIFLLGTRMVMVLRTEDHFSFEAKATNRPGQRENERVGRTDVEVSGAHTAGEGGREVGAHGKDLRRLKTVCFDRSCRTRST